MPPNLNLGVGLTTPTSVMAPPMMSPAFAFNSQLTPGLQQTPGLWTFLSVDRILYSLSFDQWNNPACYISCICPNARFVDILLVDRIASYLWLHPPVKRPCLLRLLHLPKHQVCGVFLLVDRILYGLSLVTPTSETTLLVCLLHFPGLSLSTPTKETCPVYDIPCLCPNTRFVDIFIIG